MKSSLFIAIIAAALAGCGADPQSPPFASDHPANPDAKQAPVAGHDNHLTSANTAVPHAGETGQAGVKAIAYPLEVCLVAGEDLGSMGKPYSFVYEGREIKLCCKGCEPDFREDPAMYMKKLDEAAKKQPAKPAKAPVHEHQH